MKGKKRKTLLYRLFVKTLVYKPIKSNTVLKKTFLKAIT